MKADLHQLPEGGGHIVVDDEALHAVMVIGCNPFSLPLTLDCTCVEQTPPYPPTTLLGFLE